MYNVNCDVETQENTRQPASAAAAPAQASLAAGTRASVPYTKRFVSVRCSAAPGPDSSRGYNTTADILVPLYSWSDGPSSAPNRVNTRIKTCDTIAGKKCESCKKAYCEDLKMTAIDILVVLLSSWFKLDIICFNIYYRYLSMWKLGTE